MDLSQDDLLKLFYSNNEKIECYIIVYTKSNKKKKRILALTVSMIKPVSINIYIVKSVEKGDIKPKLISSAKHLSSVNCHDYQGVQSYDIEFKCTDGKVKRIFASLIEDKHRFIERLMRVMYLHSINLFSSVEFDNLPTSIDITNIYTEGPSDRTDYESDKIYQDAGLIDTPDFSRYQNLSSVEEENIQKFLNESPGAVMNASEFQDTLRQHLLAMDGTNVHSIMTSEKQMLKLMDYLDIAIEHVEQLESKIDIQDQLLAEVEESMACLRDRDELLRLTTKNRDRVEAILENLLCQLTFDKFDLQSLNEVNFANSDSVICAIMSADKLRLLLEQPITEGLEQMVAVQSKTKELNGFADAFGRNIASQFNNSLMRHVNKLTAISTTSFDKLIEIHNNNRDDLKPYADFIVWLKRCRPSSFQEVQKVYIDKFSNVYEQEINSMIDLVKSKLVSKDKIATVNVNRISSHSINQAQKLIEKNRSRNNSESSLPGTVEPGRFKTIFEDFICKLKPLVNNEESFITRLFQLDCRRASERSSQTNHRPQTSLANNIYLYFVSGQIFRPLSTQLKTLIQLLEQYDPGLSLFMVVIVNRQYDDIVRASEFLQSIWSLLFVQTKQSFNGYIEKFIASFREIKAPKKSRCGILPFVTMYASFAEQTTFAFQDSQRQNDLIIAHQNIVRSIIIEIDRVAAESIKTPKEVILMENHHKMKDILRHLKWPELDELYDELKNRYEEALDNYAIVCVGRPFEKLYIFFEDVSVAIESGIKYEDIGYMFKFTRTELKKVIHEYPGKEVKKGLEHLCKKVEKYVSDDSGLFQVIWLSIQKQFMDECLHYETLIDKCYPNANVKLEFTRAELEQYFKEIAATR